MKPLEKGKTYPVRLHTGEVVEAVYNEPCSMIAKNHWVLISGKQYYAASKILSCCECRFVCNPCVLVPVGVSV